MINGYNSYNIPLYLQYIWVNFITTEPCSPEAWNHGECIGQSYQIAELFRFVKYYNLPRCIAPIIIIFMMIYDGFMMIWNMKHWDSTWFYMKKNELISGGDNHHVVFGCLRNWGINQWNGVPSKWGVDKNDDPPKMDRLVLKKYMGVS